MRKGSHLTPEQHKKLCDAVKGKKRPPRTEEHRKHLSESTKRNMAAPENGGRCYLTKEESILVASGLKRAIPEDQLALPARA